MADTGISIIRDMPNIKSLAHPHCADIDVEATYPTLEDVMNISKETTYRELVGIRGLTEGERRDVGINLSGGISNSVEIAVTVLKLPGFIQIENIYAEARMKTVI